MQNQEFERRLDKLIEMYWAALATLDEAEKEVDELLREIREIRERRESKSHQQPESAKFSNPNQ